MSYQYCNNHSNKVKMNRLFFNNLKIVAGKKQGSKTFLDCYWCQKCEKIYKINIQIKPEIIQEVKN